MADEIINRIIYYPGEKPELDNAKKVARKNVERIIILGVVLFWFSMVIGLPTLITLGKKLFGIAPVIY